MPIIPATALVVILQHWSWILRLVSAVWFERLLSRYAGHWLVELAQVLDLRPIEHACAPFHQGRGKGSAVIHSVPRLVRALLVKYLFNLSYRQTEEQIDCNLLLKWFAGYSLFEAPPDHTTLYRFELWVFTHHQRLFFDQSLAQIDQQYPQERDKPQLVDTFALIARGAKTSLITLLRHLCRQMLADLEALDPQRHAALSQALDLEALFGQEGEKITPALTAEERDERLQQVVQQVWRAWVWLTESLDQEPLLPADQGEKLRTWLGYLDKIIHDETTLTLPDPERPTDNVTVTERPAKKKGRYRIVSYNDLETTFRKHANQEATFPAYNAAVLTTPHFVRETLALTGATPDPVPLPHMLHSQHHHHGFFPQKVIGDMAFGAGKTRARVHQVSDGKTQLVALLPPYEKRTDIFPPSQFTLADDGLTLTCPHGQTTAKRYQSDDRDGYDFAFSAKMCRDCPLFTPCRGQKSSPKARRKVFISFFRPQVEAAMAYNRTPQFKQEIKQRPRVERLIYNLTNLHGARRCKSTGQKKADFQLKMNATAFNLRQLIRLRHRVPPQPREACV